MTINDLTMNSDGILGWIRLNGILIECTLITPYNKQLSYKFVERFSWQIYKINGKQFLFHTKEDISEHFMEKE